MDALQAFAEEPDVVLLESALQREGVGRYSFLMAEPFERLTLPRVEFGIDPFGAVRSLLKRYSAESVPGLPPFQGGAAGVLSYELGGAWERIPRRGADEFQLPDLVIGFYDWVIAWDHESHRCWVLAHGFSHRPGQTRVDHAAETIRKVKDHLNRVPTNRPAFSPPKLRVCESPAPRWPVPGHAGLVSDFSREDYLRTVERIIEYISAGDIFQANLSQRLSAETSRSPLELYGRLREKNPAPFAAYFAHEDWAIVSASPERFLRVTDRAVETRPIKGTRRRQTAPEADLFTRDALRESEKDQAENVMIVDLLRNDLSRVCQPGSIRVPSLCQVETYETVQHLVSEIRGELAEPYDVWDLWAAAFPGGSITGVPRCGPCKSSANWNPPCAGRIAGTCSMRGSTAKPTAAFSSAH